MTFHSKLFLPLAISLAATGVASAQCPDGTPPPCDTRRAAPLTVVPKRVNPPLDDNTWIVLPFNNVTRAPDTEWLSDASVNLLSMDLSRWQDVHVIDDRRVADFMRELSRPAGSKLSFNDGVTVAKRAGAGKLVIGDVLKVGSNTTVTATVFNVRDGKQIRSARQETTVADSIMPLFGKLAREILAVPTTDANIGSVGTKRADAYKEYVAGVQALNKFDAATAKKSFEAALELDTAFALAHYKWAIASMYDDQAGAARMSQVKLSDAGNLLKLVEDTARVRHAQAAARLSSNLPSRERTLIAGQVAMVGHDFPRACDAYASIVSKDSSDVEALYGYGLCLASDDMVIAVGGDTTRLQYRSNWNTAIKAFRRALAVDPTFHLAFDPMVSLLTAPVRNGCRHAEVVETCADTTRQARYSTAPIRSGDSLVTIPRAMGAGAAPIDQLLQTMRASPSRESFEAARQAAADWVAAGPNEGRAHKSLSRLLSKLGRPAEAELELKQAMLDPALRGDQVLWMQRLDIALKLRRGRDVNRLLDSLTSVLSGELGVGAFASFAPITGRLRVSDSVFTALLKARNVPPPFIGMLTHAPRIAIGAANPDTIAGFEKAIYAVMRKGPVCDVGCLSLMSTTYMLGLRIPRTWPSFGSGADTVRRLAPARALAKGDTTALRAAARMLDSVSMSAARLGGMEDGSSLIAAESYLMLRDSVAALATIRRMTDTTLLTTPIEAVLGLGSIQGGLLWPYAMVLRADLEASVGEKTIATDWYTKFLELWSNADPEFAPLLARVRASQVKLAK
jgi:TolB-like protein/tetratricopeptide (TPR) repeat protein